MLPTVRLDRQNPQTCGVQRPADQLIALTVPVSHSTIVVNTFLSQIGLESGGMKMRSFSIQASGRQRLGLLFLLAAGSALVAGCGSQTYERRLNETKKYFDYVDQVNSSLGAPWEEWGIKFRAPREFELIDPPPEPEVDENGDPNESFTPQFDPRQPDYVDLVLPGLVGAWQAAVDVADEDEPRAAFAYVLSNHYLWLQRETDPSIEPTDFHFDVLQKIASALGEPPPADDDDRWSEGRFPPGIGYKAQKRVDLIELGNVIGGVAMNFSIYIYQVNDIQVAVLFVIPQELDRPMQTAIDFSMEWLEVSGETPSRQRKKKSGPSF